MIIKPTQIVILFVTSIRSSMTYKYRSAYIVVVIMKRIPKYTLPTQIVILSVTSRRNSMTYKSRSTYVVGVNMKRMPTTTNHVVSM